MFYLAAILKIDMCSFVFLLLIVLNVHVVNYIDFS
jgi:hypothetical protein